MKFTEVLDTIKLVIESREVPLVIGESGIGKTALAHRVAKEYNYHLVTIDANLLKEGEIGGLPTVINGFTVYATHHKLAEISEAVKKGEEVLLFIDELNRCDHAVQQELMNLILNREINGYKLDKGVNIIAAMNPSNRYEGFSESEYQVVDMDAAQENRFVWLNMEPDYNQWIKWAIGSGIESKVVEFISTFPEYLHKINDDDVRATPRSYERVSKTYKMYKEQQDTIPRSVFVNVIKGNVGKVIAEEFVSFVESNYSPLISFDDVFSRENLDENVIETIKNESHTRLYISAMNILKTLENKMSEDKDSIFLINRFVEFLGIYPIDLMVGIMKDMKISYNEVYKKAIENEKFVDVYFQAYSSIRS